MNLRLSMEIFCPPKNKDLNVVSCIHLDECRAFYNFGSLNVPSYATDDLTDDAAAVN
jgi:hypothetical protein